MKDTIELIKELGITYVTKDSEKVEKLILGGKIKWGFFIEQLLKHKLTPLAFIVLKEYFDKGIPLYISEWLSNQYYVNKYRTNLTIESIKRLLMMIEEKKIPIVVVKGIGIDAMLYKNDFIKQISDVDLLINEEDTLELKKVLQECNFIEGNYNYKENRLEDMPRRRKILFSLTKDHLSEYLIDTDDAIFPAIKIDVSVNNDWITRGKESCFGDAIRNHTMIAIPGDIQIPVMEHTYHFLYLIMHLYRHACSYRFIERGISVKLSMFNDVMVFYYKYKNIITKEFGDILKDEKIRLQVEWVLYYLDQIYGCDICGKLAIKCDPKYLNTIFGKNNELRRWNGNIEERLWGMDERNIFY